MEFNTENNNSELKDILANLANPLLKSSDLDPLMKYIGNSKYVLLGEASHGTHEYYIWRAKISQRLIKEKGFSFIAVEGDWPDCYRLNRYVKDYELAGKSASEVLNLFNRWPTWIWANWEMVAFSEWLKKYNTGLLSNNKVGFYGLDVYSFLGTMDSLIAYLKKDNQKTFQTAIKAMQCFEPLGPNTRQSYNGTPSIVHDLYEKEVVELLLEIRKNIAHYNSDHENGFSAEQNAIIAVNAEQYYKAIIRGGAESWNIRSRQIVKTLNRLMDFHGKNTKVIVWKHNTHIGDARATNMMNEGLVNVGQLIKQQHMKEGVVTVGFGSYKGSVIAGREWGDIMKKTNIPPAVNGSWEQILHNFSTRKNKLIMLQKLKNGDQIKMPLEHRAIGAVYNPEHEKYGNYVKSILPNQYDAFIYLDETTALNPLHLCPDGHQIPKTFPFGV